MYKNIYTQEIYKDICEIRKNECICSARDTNDEGSNINNKQKLDTNEIPIESRLDLGCLDGC